jgi:hypothetical protein
MLVIFTTSHFKHELYVNPLRISSYLTISTRYLPHRYQIFNAVYGNNLCLLWKTYEAHKHIDGAKSRDFSVQVWEVYLPTVFVLCTFVLVYSLQYVMVLIFFAIKLRYLRSKEHTGYGQKFGDHLNMWQLLICPSVCNLSYCSKYMTI